MMALASPPPVHMAMRNPSRIVERWTPQPSGANPEHYIPARVPTIDTVVQLLISLLNVSILAVLITRRVSAVKHWTKLQPLNWLVMFIYIDSMLFVILSAVVSLGIGSNISYAVCLFADYLCLAAYLSTKGVYYFLVEKVYLIRSVRKPRLKDKLYVFHAFGLVVGYAILTVLELIFRIGYIDSNGQCYNGIQADTLVPLLLFDTGCNIYLMVMFIIPLRNLMSYSNPNSLSRQIAIRTLIGTCITLVCTIINLVQLTIVQGERSWLCLITCNLDVFVSVTVIQWVTAKDGADTGSTDTDTQGESRNDRSMIRPEKPVMMPVKKKRRSTDFSDLDEYDDMEEGIRLEQRKGQGGNDGNLDFRTPTSRSMSREAEIMDIEALRKATFNSKLAIQKRDGSVSIDRPSSSRQTDSSDSISMTRLQHTNSSDSTTRFIDAKESRNKRNPRYECCYE